MSRLALGQTVAVAETEAKYLEKLHLFNNVAWNPKKMPQLVGKIGIITDLDEEKEEVNVRFFSWGHPEGEKRPDTKCQLNTLDVVWSTRAVNPCRVVHFVTGDRAVVVKNMNSSKPQMVSVRILDPVQRTYSLRTPQSRIFTWNQEENPDEVMLPIYAGRNMSSVMRDRCVVSTTAGDRSPRRLMHGSLPQFSGSELIEAVRRWASSGSHHEFQRVAQKNGDQVNVMIGGKTPLMVAAEVGSWCAVVALIAMGGDREAVDIHGNTLIHIAARNGHVKIVEGLLMFIASEVNKVNADGDTALHVAAREGHAACVDRLLNAHTIQSNIQNQMGECVLHTVVALPESENKKAILGRLLSNFRVNLHLCNRDDLNPLQLAIALGMEQTVYEMLTAKPPLLHSDGRQGLLPLHVAALFGRSRVLEVILEMSNEVNKTARSGRCALHFAVERWMGAADRDLERMACVQILVTAGCQVNVVDSNGHTPMHIAVREMTRHRTDIPDTVLRQLVVMNKNNAKLDDIAARCRPHWQLAVTAFLSLNGADLSARDRTGNTPYALAPSNAIREVLAEFASCRSKSCLPKSALTMSEFDTAGVTMCTFNCEDNAADVQFMPCGHRVVCRTCAATTPLRRCPLCYNTIDEARTVEGEIIELGAASQQNVKAAAEKQVEASAVDCGDKNDVVIAADEVKRIQEEAVRQAKEEADKEKLFELKALQERLDELEMAFTCAICLDSRPDVVFNCGHTACQECSTAITQCHICRQTIEKRQTIYT